jgi:hypothetical protein
MQITLTEIPVRELVQGFIDSQEEGVFGYGGKLDIRPPYQREYVYEQSQQEAVINTIMNGLPLNVMYWVDNDGKYEVLDGQQRTLSICHYYKGVFCRNFQYFANLEDDVKEKFLSYKLMVYLCKGTPSEKLEWFKTINIAGVRLSDQELRNAVFHGPWLAHAKQIFSKQNCPAYLSGKDYLKGSPIRQDFLETALDWISKGSIEQYMAANQHKPNANQLWQYFSQVITWVNSTFPEYRKEMKGVSWGHLYNEYGQNYYDSDAFEDTLSKLYRDEDVTKKPGIYSFLFTGSEKHLSIRAFTDSQKATAFARQQGVCPSCSGSFSIEGMEADHITPWSLGGRTTQDNCQLLCKQCNRTKSSK